MLSNPKIKELQEWHSRNSHDIKLILRMTLLGSLGGVLGGLLASVVCANLL